METYNINLHCCYFFKYVVVLCLCNINNIFYTLIFIIKLFMNRRELDLIFIKLISIKSVQLKMKLMKIKFKKVSKLKLT